MISAFNIVCFISLKKKLLLLFTVDGTKNIIFTTKLFFYNKDAFNIKIYIHYLVDFSQKRKPGQFMNNTLAII